MPLSKGTNFFKSLSEQHLEDNANCFFFLVLETEMDRQFSSLPTLAQLVQFITGHPYLPSRGLDITFSLTAVYPDADACFSFLRLPTIHSNYQDFRNAMNTAITCQHRGYGRG